MYLRKSPQQNQMTADQKKTCVAYDRVGTMSETQTQFPSSATTVFRTENRTAHNQVAKLFGAHSPAKRVCCEKCLQHSRQTMTMEYRLIG